MSGQYSKWICLGKWTCGTSTFKGEVPYIAFTPNSDGTWDCLVSKSTLKAEKKNRWRTDVMMQCRGNRKKLFLCRFLNKVWIFSFKNCISSYTMVVMTIESSSWLTSRWCLIPWSWLYTSWQDGLLAGDLLQQDSINQFNFLSHDFGGIR